MKSNIPRMVIIIDSIQAVNDYYFIARVASFGSTSWEIMLDVTYTEENYKLEIERLSSIRNGTPRNGNPLSPFKRGLAFDENCRLFNYPTFVAKYHSRYSGGYGAYEYACLDIDNHRIIYIELKITYRELKVPSQYLPLNFWNNKKESTSDSYYYTIYTSKDEKIVWLD